MTPLADLLARRIAAGGPITLAEYMAECLLHPTHGYYTSRTAIGAAGDFTTAPEISQMFGELLGLCLAQGWLDQGAAKSFTLAELGPGRGTLMADILRATRTIPGFHAAARLHLVEASPAMRARQAQALAGYRVQWHDHPDALSDTAPNAAPEGPLFAVANEFFDALPIRQFTRHRLGWCETMVGLAAGGAQPPTLMRGLSAPAPLQAIAHRLADTRPGDVVETCAPATAIAAGLAARIARHGGMALIIDYGGWGGLGDTFQALQAHGFADPFAAPGRADLTAHVDFQALARLAAPARHAFTTQGALLAALGMAARCEKLGRNLTGAALTRHHAAYHRLTAPSEMGTLFKALALFPATSRPPTGFA